MQFYKDEKVKTSLGVGVVVYQRMKAPDYAEAEAVSIKLIHRQDEKDYQGTMFPASEVTKLQ